MSQMTYSEVSGVFLSAVSLSLTEHIFDLFPSLLLLVYKYSNCSPPVCFDQNNTYEL